MVAVPRDERIKKYLIETLDNMGIQYDVKEDENVFIFYTDVENEEQKETVADLLIWFYKTKILCERINCGEMDKTAYCAFIGALVGVERARERERIMAVLPSVDCLNLSGIFDFSIEEVRKEWYNLAKLGDKLYGQCAEEKDVYSLCIFLLGANEEKHNTVFIDAQGILYSEGGKEKCIVVPYFCEEEENYVFSLLSRSPSDVVVNDPSALPKGALNVIRALGEQ